MKSNKKNKWLYILAVILIVIVSIVLYTLFNYGESGGEVSLNFSEQRWIQNNKNKIINVLIPNNLPVFSSEGKGAFFSFLDYFQNGTELEFNKTPYLLEESDNTKDNRFRILGSNDKLGSNDLLFYNDNYVVVGKASQKMLPLNELDGTIGILNNDFNDVTSYLDNNTLTFTKVVDINALTTALDNGSVSYIIIPMNLYLNIIVQKNYYILNTLNDLSLKYVLT
jgi:hypothetical protein